VFEPGSIHKQEFFDYWKDVLQANEWVLDLLKNGYRIPFKESPSKYFEKNNKSARDNMAVVKQIVAEMISQGIVTVCKDRPTCVSPLGLVTKVKNGVTKHRLVWDASRHVNKYVQEKHVKLQHLPKALEMTKENDWQCIFDLAQCYYHIRVEDAQKQFLGAAIENTDGSLLYFCYNNLPFGLSSAVHAVTKIWKPISRHLFTLGIRNSIFIDDGRILGESEMEIEKFRGIAYGVIKAAGWAIERDKSDGKGHPRKKKEYLGFEIDTESMTVVCPMNKLSKIITQLKALIQEQFIYPKELASILGKISSLEISHGALARITTRSSYIALSAHVEAFGWGRRKKIVWSNLMLQELRFLLLNIEKRNGCKISSNLPDIRVKMLLENPLSSVETVKLMSDPIIMASDASDFKAFVYKLDQNNQEIFS